MNMMDVGTAIRFPSSSSSSSSFLLSHVLYTRNSKMETDVSPASLPSSSMMESGKITVLKGAGKPKLVFGCLMVLGSEESAGALDLVDFQMATATKESGPMTKCRELECWCPLAVLSMKDRFMLAKFPFALSFLLSLPRISLMILSFSPFK